MIKFKIVERRMLWHIIVGVIIIAGLMSIFTRGFNLGIDFTGGTLLELNFDNPVAIEDVRSVMKEHGLENSVIQLASGNEGDVNDSIVMIRTGVLTDDVNSSILSKLNEKIGAFNVLRIERVGAVIGGEIAQQAILAIIVSWVLMIAYITWRFEFKFAVSAILALLQNVLVVLSAFSIFYIELDATFVAALLTVIGFSINDTIVIFDRIRENLRTYRRADPLEDLINKSIWQTMARSIYTVMTVLFVTASLYFFGGDTTRNFSLALIIGFSFGCFTSIFCAGSFWYELSTLKAGKK